jgi:hypothetical protein
MDSKLKNDPRDDVEVILFRDTRANVRASLRLVAAFLVVLTCAGVAAATSFFYLDSDGSTESTIYRVERTTGQLTFLGSLPEPSYALAAASDQVLFVVSTTGSLLDVTLDPFTVSQVGFLGLSGVVGLAFANGQLMATDEDTRSLYRIQLTPLAATLIGPVLLDGSPLDLGGGDIAVDAAGTWYLWSNGTLALYRLDVTTGVATLLPAPSPPPGTLGGLAIDFDDGSLIASSAQPQSRDALVTLDPTGAKPIVVEPLCLSCPTPFHTQYGDLASVRVQTQTPCTDADGDGYSPEGGACGPIDCDDTNPAVHPGAPEVCNGRDDNCDGVIDEEPAASQSCGGSCEEVGQCAAGHCTMVPRPSVDQVLCGLDALSPPAAICPGQAMDGGLKQLVASTVNRSRVFVVDAQRMQSSGRPKSVHRLVRAADRQLAKVVRKARRMAKRTNSPSSGCAHILDDQVSTLRKVLALVGS